MRNGDDLAPLFDARARKAGPLQLGEDAGGPRHFLLGTPVHAGAILLLAINGAGWVEGRYEWSFNATQRPLFIMQGPGGRLTLPLPDHAVLRWPKP